MKKIVFIAWTNYHRRSELLAHHFGAKIFYISYGKKGRLLDTIAKYPIQTLQTWKILRTEKPTVIFVQSPPIFCALVAYLFGRFFGSTYIIDSHTGAFLDPRWRKFLGLHRWLSRRALMTIVHNRSQDMMIKEWNCPHCAIGFTPGSYPEGDQFPFHAQFNVVVISTYGEDEPLAIIFAAARTMPNVAFYITGDDKHIDQHLRETKPENCHLTGYLTYTHYVGLLRNASAVMDLTTRDDTLLMGGFEAVSLGAPLITSDWPILKEYFSLGTVHIPNTVEGVREGIRFVMKNDANLKQEMIRAQKVLQAEWEQKYKELQALIQDFEIHKSTKNSFP